MSDTLTDAQLNSTGSSTTDADTARAILAALNRIDARAETIMLERARRGDQRPLEGSHHLAIDEERAALRAALL